MKKFIKQYWQSAIILVLLFMLFSLSWANYYDPQTEFNVWTQGKYAELSLSQKVELGILHFLGKFGGARALASNTPDAITDGVDDEVQINAQIVVANSAGTGIVRLCGSNSSLNMNIGATIVLLSGVRLEGYGVTINLQDASECNMIQIVRPGIRQSVEGIEFNGNRTGQVGTFSIMGTFGGTSIAKGFTIKNIRLLNASAWALNIESPTDVLVDHCYFYNSASGHIRWHAGEGSTIRDCIFDTVSTSGSIDIDQWGHEITGCIFRNETNVANSPHIVLFSNASGPNGVIGTRIIGNYFNGKYPTVAGERGISMDVSDYISETTANIISGNTFSNLAYGIITDGNAFNINNNSFDDGSYAWYTTEACERIEFCHNNIDGTLIPITVANVTKSKIDSNIVTGATFPLYLSSCNNSSVSNNILTDFSRGALEFDACSDLQIKDNICKNIGTLLDDSATVIWMANVTGICTNNIISGNQHTSDNVNTPNYFLVADGSPTGNIITDNKMEDTHGMVTGFGITTYRHNTGFVTENYGSSVGTGAQQTIAHGLSFTPIKAQIGLWSDNTTLVVLSQTANPDATNIYVTNNTTGSAWHWSTIGN
ncbi:hypothetical protein M0R04_08200 [Candidatus Dojkabacteria bacterium]|jgi:hypothetical protein|nr:hypothetical protein [Candidatus Dojkabacteria bacterium]